MCEQHIGDGRDMNYRRFDGMVIVGARDADPKLAQRIAVCLAAAICCLLGTAMAPRRALAQDGSLTIRSRQRGEPTYVAYQVFDADVDEAGLSRHITWASPELRDDVLDVLDDAGYGQWLDKAHPGPGQREHAQNAAEFIGGSIGRDEQSQAGSHKPSRSLLISLARSLEADERIKAVSLVAGREAIVPQGQWIVFSNSESSTDVAHSAPLWVTVGTEPASVNEKADIPTLEKQVRDPSDDVWKKAATVHAGQVCSFRIIGTLPSNLSAYEHFPYCVTDQLPAGCRLSLAKDGRLEGAVIVSIGGKEIKPDGTHLVVSYEKRTLTVLFADLADTYWDDFGLAPDKNVLITYSATLTRGASSAQTGNVNNATLSYSNDPLHQSLVRTGETKSCLLTHTLTLQKRDARSKSPLAGARFSIQREGSGSKATKQAYVQADGSLGSKPHIFVTGKDGTLTIRGIGQGSYRIVEETAPSGYRKSNEPIKLAIAASVDAQTSCRTELTARTSSEVATVESVDAKEGTITLAITNESDEQPPDETTVERLAQTGVGPIAASLAGVGLLLIALSLAAERRR